MRGRTWQARRDNLLRTVGHLKVGQHCECTHKKGYVHKYTLCLSEETQKKLALAVLAGLEEEGYVNPSKKECVWIM